MIKRPFLFYTMAVLFSAFTCSSCSAVEGIFKAGMGFGIFIVVAIIALIVFFVMKAGKNK